MHAVLVVMALSLPSMAASQDAEGVLKRVQSTYAAMQSYSQRFSTRLTRRVDQGPAVTVGSYGELRVARPNKLFLTLTSPATGTIVAVCDGVTLTTYASKTNVYRRQPAPGTLAAVVRALRPYGIGMDRDPLYFFAAGTGGHGIVAPRLKPAVTLSGARCLVVSGTFSVSLPRGTRQGVATLSVDAASHLLRKVELSLPSVPVTATVRTKRSGRPATERRTMRVSSTSTLYVQGMQANPTLGADAFRFAPPKGAVEDKLSSPGR